MTCNLAHWLPCWTCMHLIIFLNYSQVRIFYSFAVVNMLLIITTATTATTTVLVIGVIVLLSLLPSSLSSQGRLLLKYGFCLLNLSDITSRIGMLMTYLCTRFPMLTSSGSSLSPSNLLPPQGCSSQVDPRYDTSYPLYFHMMP